MLLWPGLPQNPGLSLLGFSRPRFPGKPAKTLASLAWRGLAGLTMLLTILPMQGQVFEKHPSIIAIHEHFRDINTPLLLLF